LDEEKQSERPSKAVHGDDVAVGVGALSW